MIIQTFCFGASGDKKKLLNFQQTFCLFATNCLISYSSPFSFLSLLQNNQLSQSAQELEEELNLEMFNKDMTARSSNSFFNSLIFFNAFEYNDAFITYSM